MEVGAIIDPYTGLYQHQDACSSASGCYGSRMRTTVVLEPDVQAAVDRIRRDEGIGVSEALNRLVRAGLVQGGAARRKRFAQRTARLGIRIDLTSVEDALEQLDGPASS